MCSQLTEELQILREDNQEKTEIIVKLQKDLDRHAKGLETGNSTTNLFSLCCLMV